MTLLMRKSAMTGILLFALAGLLAASPLALAQSTNGSFNLQTQFPIGSTVTINSVYGLGGPVTSSFNVSLTLTAQVTSDTPHGDIAWTIKSGSIIENGVPLTITGGSGGIGKLDRILVVGNATDSNGHIYSWGLGGLAAMNDGTVMASLNGISSYNPNPSTSANRQAPQIKSPYESGPNGVPLSFIVTVE